MSNLPSLTELFNQQETRRAVEKWSHYFPIYERHLHRYRQQSVRVLEIGVAHGGSLQMWKRYFGATAAVIGIDINPRCRNCVEDGIEIIIGDQSDPRFLQQLIEAHADFDIIIDDGSHIANHQIASFSSLWPHVRDGGTYLVEDCHTAYWPEYGGGVRSGASFIDFAKDKIDVMNASHSRDPQKLAPSRLTFEIGGMHFYDSVVVFEKNVRTRQPHPVSTGNYSH